MVHHHGFFTSQRSCITHYCERMPGHTPGGWYPVCKGPGTPRTPGGRAASLRACGDPAPLSPHPSPLTQPPWSVLHPSPGRPCLFLHPSAPLSWVIWLFPLLLKYSGKCRQEASGRRKPVGGRKG